jgi:hypothetical protein
MNCVPCSGAQEGEHKSRSRLAGLVSFMPFSTPLLQKQMCESVITDFLAPVLQNHFERVYMFYWRERFFEKTIFKSS